MSYSDAELIRQAQSVADAFVKAANRRFKTKLAVPIPLSFDLADTDPKAAGMAYGSIAIKLNIFMLRLHTDGVINDTIPHEVAHLVVESLLPGKKYRSHGPEWREVHLALGRKPYKTHNFFAGAKAAMEYKKSLKNNEE